MGEFLLSHEPAIRLAGFAGMLAAMALLEIAAPRRARRMPLPARWRTNLGLAVTGTLTVRLVLPVLAAGTAVWAQDRGVGLFNVIGAPFAVSAAISFLVLDLLIYGQHAAFHRFAPLWRLHRVHHADPEIDTSTGVRFHPLEILISMLVKMAAVTALGAPAASVILFEVALNATSLFNHANLRLPARADSILRLAIVTPDMHRVHHSIYRDEHDMNFGFNLSLWDRLFGTYRAQPRDGHTQMRIGLAAYPGSGPMRLGWCLVLPFLGAARGDAPSGATRREPTP
jgi:sterol desaturase/sphingolipid hydroxylase (fatty acid hydroxylase superfamily)